MGIASSCVLPDNLADLLLSRRVPPIPLTSRPARFWDDVFVPSGAAWSTFVESMLWHLLLIVLFVWGQSRVWTSVQLFPKRRVIHQPITYYPPARSFPAAGGRAPGVPARSKMAHAQQPAHQPAMPVTPQQSRASSHPPTSGKLRPGRRICPARVTLPLWCHSLLHRT
jgi:hypothetical protein